MWQTPSSKKAEKINPPLHLKYWRTDLIAQHFEGLPSGDALSIDYYRLTIVMECS